MSVWVKLITQRVDVNRSMFVFLSALAHFRSKFEPGLHRLRKHEDVRGAPLASPDPPTSDTILIPLLRLTIAKTPWSVHNPGAERQEDGEAGPPKEEGEEQRREGEVSHRHASVSRH